jgi:hypothetical protein
MSGMNSMYTENRGMKLLYIQRLRILGLKMHVCGINERTLNSSILTNLKNKIKNILGG